MNLDSSSSSEDIVAKVVSDGFFCKANPNIGQRVDNMVAGGLQFKSEEGLDFCKVHTFDDEVSGGTMWESNLIFVSVFGVRSSPSSQSLLWDSIWRLAMRLNTSSAS